MGGYKYLRVMEAKELLHDKMKEKIGKEYLRRVKKGCRIQIECWEFNARNQYMGLIFDQIYWRNHQLDKEGIEGP